MARTCPCVTLVTAASPLAWASSCDCCCRRRCCSLRRRLKTPWRLLLQLRRHVPWARAWTLLGLALLVSLLLPRAPLHDLLLLSEASERQRLLGENELRLQHSVQVLEAYRRGLGGRQGQQGGLRGPHPAEGDPRQKVEEEEEEQLPHDRFEDAVLFGRDPRSQQDLRPTPAPDEAIAGEEGEKQGDARPPGRGPGGFYPSGRLADGRPVEVAVTVVTTTRGRRLTPQGRAATNYSTQYLTQSVAHLLELLQEDGLQRSYSLTICNVDERPEMFPEARQLEDLLPFTWRYGNPDSRGNDAAGREEAGATVEGDMRAEAGRPPQVIWEKLKADYIYCLERTVDSGATYALLVEDDAIAHRHLLRVLERVIERVLEGVGLEREGAAGGGSSVAYVKLYHPRRLLGYLSPEPERLLELLALSVLLGAGLAGLLSAGPCPSQTRGRGRGRRPPAQPPREMPVPGHHPHHHHPPRSGTSQPGVKTKTRGEKSLFHKPAPSPLPLPPPPPPQPPISPAASSAEPSGGTRRGPPHPGGGGSEGGPRLLRVWLGWSLAAGLLALAVGRPNLLEWRRLSPQLYQVAPAPSCCIPAVLYTRAGAAGLARFLANVTCTARASTDIRMDEWRWGAAAAAAPGGGSVRGLMVQPNLFSHVGLVSSLRTREVSPLIIP